MLRAGFAIAVIIKSIDVELLKKGLVARLETFLERSTTKEMLEVGLPLGGSVWAPPKKMEQVMYAGNRTELSKVKLPEFKEKFPEVEINHKTISSKYLFKKINNITKCSLTNSNNFSSFKFRIQIGF